MMSTCQNLIFTLSNEAPHIKFEFALWSPPSHHLAFGYSLGFSPNFLYNGAMGSHIVSCNTSYWAWGRTVRLYTYLQYNTKVFGVTCDGVLLLAYMVNSWLVVMLLFIYSWYCFHHAFQVMLVCSYLILA